MTSRQSNILFYSAICFVVLMGLLNYFSPSFFDQFTKSETELSIQDAINKGEFNRALAGINQVIREDVDTDAVDQETAVLYEKAAELYAELGNTAQQRDYYFKSLEIRQPLVKKNRYSVAMLYYHLGELSLQQSKSGDAQRYFEQSLSTWMGSIIEAANADTGIFEGLQNEHVKYKRLNHRQTILILHKLGDIHTSAQEFTVARQYYRRALDASREVFGEDSVEVSALEQLLDKLSAS